MENDKQFRKLNITDVEDLDNKTNYQIDKECPQRYINEMMTSRVGEFNFDGNMSFMIGKYISSYLQYKRADDLIHKKYF